MNTKVKDFILLETREVIQFNNFDEIYYIFEQTIDHNVAAYAVEGISERMTTALNQIATEKIDRMDILSCFSELSSCFEPYVKKILYLVDKKKYDELKRKKNTSLPNYLEALGLSAFEDEDKKTPRSTQLRDTYKLRNIASHECRKWSFVTLYKKLQGLLCSYLIIIEKQFRKLKEVLFNKELNNKYCPFNINSFKRMSPEYILRFLEWGIYTMNPMIKRLRNESGMLRFDQEGLLDCGTYKAKDYNVEDSFVYQKEEHIHRRERYSLKVANGVHSKLITEYCEYFYDLNGRVVEAVYYSYTNKNEYRKQRSIFLTFLSNGGLEIVDRRHTLEADNDTVMSFDNTGRLLSKQNEKEQVVYEYVNGELSKIVGCRGIVEVKRMDCEQIFVEKEVNRNEGILTEKRIYDGKNLIRRELYKKNEKNGTNEVSFAWDIEYHSK